MHYFKLLPLSLLLSSKISQLLLAISLLISPSLFAQFPYTAVDGWSSIVSSSCSGWATSTLSLGTPTIPGRINVNGGVNGATIEGAFSTYYADGPGVDAFITSYYNSGGTIHSVRLRLSDGSLTGSITYSPIFAGNTDVTYAFCSSGGGSGSSVTTWYEPIDFAAFSIPVGLWIVGAEVTAPYIVGSPDMGQFVITDNAITGPTLPVELINFNATCNSDNRAIDLKWQTATEQHNDYFLVEKSTDLINWEFVDQVSGVGTSTEMNSYSTVDISPFKDDISYYRLSQVDFDGSATIKKIVSVECENQSTFSTFPNPLESTLFFSSQENGELQLVDNTGRIVLQKSINAGTGSINHINIASGVYTSVFITNNGIKHSKKLIKL